MTDRKISEVRTALQLQDQATKVETVSGRGRCIVSVGATSQEGKAAMQRLGFEYSGLAGRWYLPTEADG